MASFAPLAVNTGFDPPSGASPRPSQSVFVDQTTLVRLVGGKNHDLSLEPSGTTDLIVSDNKPSADGSRILRLKGVKSGAHVTLLAKDPSATNPLLSEARLEIDVMTVGTRTVRFYRLLDGGGNEATRPLASVKQVLFEASVIHSLQNGVFLNFQGSQDLILKVDLGRIVHTVAALNHLEGLFASGVLDMCQADFHVFLVWAVESNQADVASGKQKTLAATRKNLCLIEDFSQSASQALAHEAGHYLQEPSVTGFGHHLSSDNLMFKTARGGKHLDRVQCANMNANTHNGRLQRACGPRSQP